MKIPPARHTKFLEDHPDKWQKIIPLIKDIDKQYKLLFPEHYKKQRAMADKTKYKIPGTSFTTVTTNVNLQTGVHTDKGDYEKGFGNLVVIESGKKYKGGFTGMPQYGVAADVRTGDFLGMDVHQLHGNEPLDGPEGEYERLSLVCYLRERIVEKTKGVDLLPLDFFKKVIERAKTGPRTRKLRGRKRKPKAKNATNKKGQPTRKRYNALQYEKVHTKTGK